MFFPMVDVLRAFAAISVMVYHVIAHFEWKDFPVTGPLSWFRVGGMGVDLFFVISGFVIAESAFARLQRGSLREFVKSFVTARLTRIIPLHYVTCLLFVVFVVPDLILVPDIWKQLLSHAVMLHSWFL